MLGREVATPVSLLTESRTVEEQLPWIEDLHLCFAKMHHLVAEVIGSAYRSTKKYVDQRQKGLHFTIGHKVWVYDPKPRPNQSPKLNAQKWSGPWIIS